MADILAGTGWIIDPITGQLRQRSPLVPPAGDGGGAWDGYSVPPTAPLGAPPPSAVPRAPIPPAAFTAPTSTWQNGAPPYTTSPGEPMAASSVPNVPPYTMLPGQSASDPNVMGAQSGNAPIGSTAPPQGLPPAAVGAQNGPIGAPAPPPHAPAAPVPVSTPAVPPNAPNVDRYSAMLPNIHAGEGNDGKGGFGILDPTWNDFKASDVNQKLGFTDADRLKPEAQQAAALWNMARNDGQLKSSLGRPVSDGELGAAWLLGPKGATAFIQNPTANAYDLYSQVTSKKYADAAFGANGDRLVKTDTAGQTLGKIASYYHLDGSPVVGGGADAQSPTAAPAAATPPPNDAAAAPAQGAPSGMAALYAKYGIQPMSATDEGLALAGGLLSGPTFGAGLGKGLQALAAMRQQERTNGIQAAHLDATLQQLGIMGNYRGAQITHMGNQDVTATGKLGVAQQNADTNVQNAGAKAAGVDLNVKRLDSQLSGATAQGAVMGKDAGTDMQHLQDTVEEDQAALQDANAARQMIQGHPELLGTTIKAKLARAMTSAGLIGDPNDLSVGGKAMTAGRNEYIREQSNAHSFPRSNAELNNVGSAVPSLETNPQAADWLLQSSQRRIMANMAWRDQVNELQSSNPNALTGSRYFNTKSQFMQDYFTKNKLPDYGAGPPASAQNAAPWSHTTSGGYTFTVAPSQ